MMNWKVLVIKNQNNGDSRKITDPLLKKWIVYSELGIHLVLWLTECNDLNALKNTHLEEYTFKWKYYVHKQPNHSM